MLKEADLDAALAVIEKQDTIANIAKNSVNGFVNFFYSFHMFNSPLTKNIFIEFHKTNIFNFFMVVNTQ